MFQWLQNYLLEHTLFSPVIYLVSHILFAIFLIPCSPMALLAGAIWGKGMGLGISMFSAFLSSCITFGLSRFFLKNRIYQFLSKRYSKIDWFLEQTTIHGWKFVAGVQLNPAAPASTLGYLFGLSNIPFFVYAMYLLLFMIPLQLLFVITGDSFSIVYSSQLFWPLVGILLIFFVIYFFYKKKLNKIYNRKG